MIRRKAAGTEQVCLAEVLAASPQAVACVTGQGARQGRVVRSSGTETTAVEQLGVVLTRALPAPVGTAALGCFCSLHRLHLKVNLNQ